MKLEELAVDGIQPGDRVRLSRFSDGLTFVYGENSSGKSSSRNLFRQTLFGRPQSSQSQRNPSLNGKVIVSFRNDRLELERTDAISEQLLVKRIQRLDGSLSPSNVGVGQDFLQGISPAVYDSIFSFSFKETQNNSLRLARVMQDEFQIGLGPAFAGDDSVYLARQRELEAANARMDSLRSQISLLQQKRADLLKQGESQQIQLQRQLTDLEAQISSLQTRLSQYHSAPLMEELARVNSELASLRLRIETAQAEVIYPTVEPALDHLATLYQRLDEIDNQIHRWRHLQADIQNQRLRLRDEMLVWNELTLEDDQHPYHLAREILVGLESKVDQAERNAQHWVAAGGARVDTDQMAKTLGQLCQSMRDDIYNLCNELGHQYKHIRHRSAAAELKQLRRCYTEMGENIERLVRRRASVVREIRELDPAGADAIARADNQFCQCAQHEGYLAARKRFVGDTFVQPKPVRVEPDLTAERSRVAELERRRIEIQTETQRVEQRTSEISLELASLNRQRDEIVASINALNLPSVASIDNEITQLYSQVESLKGRSDLTLTTVQANPVLVQASSLLRRLTDNALIRVFLSQASSELDPHWLVHDQHGNAVAFEKLDYDRQDQVYLALVLAAKEAISQRGVVMPTLIDDAFCRIAGDRINPTLSLLNEWGHRGHQFVVFTQHRYLADRIPGVTVLSLDTAVEPIRSSRLASPSVTINSPSTVRPLNPEAIRFGDNDWARQNQFDDVYIDDSLTAPYPLSKYSSVDPKVDSTLHYQTDLPNPIRRQSVSYDIAPEIYPLPSTDTRTTREVRHADYPAPTRSTRTSSSEPYMPVSVETIGQPIVLVPPVNDTTLLEATGLFDAAQLRNFDDYGVREVREFMSIDPADEQLGLSADQVDRWQSQLWLLMNVPSLRPQDACALVACGITEPVQLTTSHAQQIYERLNRFLATTRGRQTQWSNLTISMDRIGGWLAGLEQTRSRWQSRRRPRQGRTFTSRSRGERQPRASQRDWEPTEQTDRQRVARAYDATGRSYDRSGEPSTSGREPRPARPPRMHSNEMSDRDIATRQNLSAQQTSTNDANLAPRLVPVGRSREADSSGAKPRTERQLRPQATKPTATKSLKFYLDLDDHIEAAPSIGPKTAERFEKIGVVTVADFLKQTAESIATKLNYKRLSADLIREWQHQARLVCRVPNLRGHDAQLLVACDIIEPEDLATMQPKSLFELIEPFAESKDGQKIIRNGKKPDLEEVTDWIAWAGDQRSIQAA